MLKREKLTGKSKFIWVILGFLLMLPLAGSCSKEDSKENVVIPDIALNKSELTLEKGKTVKTSSACSRDFRKRMAKYIRRPL